MQSVKNSLTIGRLAISTNKGLKYRNGKLNKSHVQLSMEKFTLFLLALECNGFFSFTFETKVSFLSYRLYDQTSALVGFIYKFTLAHVMWQFTVYVYNSNEAECVMMFDRNDDKS